MPAPPVAQYSVDIDVRFLTTEEVPDGVFRVYVLLEHFLAKRDGRKKPAIGANCLAAILGRDVESCLDRLKEMGALSRVSDEGWDSTGDVTVGGSEVQLALGCFEGPKRKKLDTRVFFCPAVSDRAARVWAAATLKLLGDVADAQGWSPDDVKAAADELAGFGLATYNVGKGEVEVNAKKLPEDGLRVVEFTSDELGKVGGAGSSKSTESMRKERAEKKRRAASRQST